MRSSHTPGSVSAGFDDPSLIGYAGLVPLVRLAERVGLPALVSDHLDLGVTINSAGAGPVAKVMSVVAGICAGADSIEDLGRLRHGAMDALFDEIRAPSTLGTFLRCFTYGHNRQLGAVHRRLLARLAGETSLLPGADHLAFVDIDPSHIRVYGRAKQGAQYGRFKGIRTLNPILSTISTPGSAPVIGPVRLRQGRAADVRGATSFVTEAIGTAREAGCSGTVIVRADSKFYAGKVIAACRRRNAHYSIATGMNPSIRTAIAGIDEDAWIEIEYPHAIEDPDTGELISIAQIAEVPYTAFASDRKHAVTARLIVRRVRDLAKLDQGQDELFPAYRYHALFTDSPHELERAEPEHRGHAIIESQIADLKDSALAHLPSGRFEANHAWLILAAIAHNLQRAAASIAGGDLTNAKTATIRTRLIQIPGRIARSARRITVHLPEGWRWAEAWIRLFESAHAPPLPVTII
jgi:Transposase DDE domain group 1